MLIAVLLTGSNVFAHDFEAQNSDGVTIYYNIISATDLTCEVTYRGSSVDEYSGEYTGTVVIPTSVTNGENTYSVTSIGDYAFTECGGLTSVTIPNSVTSIGQAAFSGCTGLTSVYINDLEAWCKIDFENQNANPLYYTGELYLNNKLVTNIEIPNTITIIKNNAFCGYESLFSITIPNSVTSIGQAAFSGCSGLTSVTIPNSVTSIGGHAFYGCSGLTNITIPNSVTNIGDGAFSGCDDLYSITIPNSVTNIGDGAFSRCNNLISINIPNSVTSIASSTFYSCDGLTSVTIPNSVTSIGSTAFEDCRALTSVTIPNSVTSIGFGAFHNCSSLTSITIPNSVTSIGQAAFSGCSGLTSVVFNAENCTEMGGQHIYSVFRACSALSTVTIGEKVKAIPNYAFYDCTGLTNVTIPNSVTSIGNQAFWGCSGLTSVTIGNSVTSIGDYAFKECGGLTSVTIPNSVTSIGNYSFSYCSALTSVTIPNSVEKIGKNAFESCSALKSVSLGNSLSIIGNYTFKDCNNITKVESKNSTAPTMTEVVFPTTVYENAQLVVPLEASESYQSATGWSKFTNTQTGYNVTVDYSSTGGVVSVNDSIATSLAIDFDTKVDFVITPKEGFEIEKVTLNEEDITENVVDGKYSLEKLTEDVIFAVTFRKLYTIATIFNSEEGVVTINGQEKNPIQVSFDTKVDFEITPNEGYEIDKVLLNEVDITADVVDGKYSIEKASEDVALNVTFRKLLVIGATFNNEEGRVTINGAEVNPILVSTGSTLDFVITPNESYEIDKVLLNEVDVTEHLQEGLLHIENVAGNVVLNVTFRKMMLIVTEFASEYGSVTINESEETSMFVSLGSKLDFTITPNEGYEIINVTLNDEDITADAVEGKYTIENATENVKLTVTFKLKTFALVLKCCEAGAFKRILNYGETATYEIVPSENWEINTVTFNGTDVTTELVDNVFTTPEITEDSELSVVFVDIASSVFSVYYTSDVNVYASQQTISIKGLVDNTTVAVYNPNGQMEYSKVATDYEMNINMNKDGVYLVKVGERTFKVIL